MHRGTDIFHMRHRTTAEELNMLHFFPVSLLDFIYDFFGFFCLANTRTRSRDIEGYKFFFDIRPKDEVG